MATNQALPHRSFLYRVGAFGGSAAVYQAALGSLVEIEVQLAK